MLAWVNHYFPNFLVVEILQCILNFSSWYVEWKKKLLNFYNGLLQVQGLWIRLANARDAGSSPDQELRCHMLGEPSPGAINREALHPKSMVPSMKQQRLLCATVKTQRTNCDKHCIYMVSSWYALWVLLNIFGETRFVPYIMSGSSVMGDYFLTQ